LGLVYPLTLLFRDAISVLCSSSPIRHGSQKFSDHWSREIQAQLVSSPRQQAIGANPHDFIRFPFFVKTNRLTEIEPLYRKGMSLNEIERSTGIKKSSVRKFLLNAGVVLRSKHPDTSITKWRTRGKTHAKPPYGFCYVDGRIARHPKEYPTLLAIIRRWKDGQRANSIATYLNDKRIPSPMNKTWSWNSVDNIIKRIELKQIVRKGEHYELR
jgi:hypothetical protein